MVKLKLIFNLALIISPSFQPISRFRNYELQRVSPTLYLFLLSLRIHKKVNLIKMDTQIEAGNVSGPYYW